MNRLTTDDFDPAEEMKRIEAVTESTQNVVSDSVRGIEGGYRKVPSDPSGLKSPNAPSVSAEGEDLPDTGRRKSE